MIDNKVDPLARIKRMSSAGFGAGLELRVLSLFYIFIAFISGISAFVISTFFEVSNYDYIGMIFFGSFIVVPTLATVAFGVRQSRKAKTAEVDRAADKVHKKSDGAFGAFEMMISPFAAFILAFINDTIRSFQTNGAEGAGFHFSFGVFAVLMIDGARRVKNARAAKNTPIAPIVPLDAVPQIQSQVATKKRGTEEYTAFAEIIMSPIFAGIFGFLFSEATQSSHTSDGFYYNIPVSFLVFSALVIDGIRRMRKIRREYPERA